MSDQTTHIAWDMGALQESFLQSLHIPYYTKRVTTLCERRVARRLIVEPSVAKCDDCVVAYRVAMESGKVVVI